MNILGVAGAVWLCAAANTAEGVQRSDAELKAGAPAHREKHHVSMAAGALTIGVPVCKPHCIAARYSASSC